MPIPRTLERSCSLKSLFRGDYNGVDGRGTGERYRAANGNDRKSFGSNLISGEDRGDLMMWLLHRREDVLLGVYPLLLREDRFYGKQVLGTHH